MYWRAHLKNVSQQRLPRFTADLQLQRSDRLHTFAAWLLGYLPVAVGEDKAVTVDPLRVVRVELEETGPENVGDGGHALHGV